MDRKELEGEVDRLLLKKVRSEKLTKREELSLAYEYHAGGCSSRQAVVKVGC
jgi:hypothetical protein